MKRFFATFIAAGLMMSILLIPASASDTNAETAKTTPETKASTTVKTEDETEKVLCVKCGKQMHMDLEKKPIHYSEWGVIDTFICNHWNGGMYTVDDLLQRLVVKTYFCDDCGTKQIVATHEYKDRCNFKK